jgi:hypothetical protein
VPICVRLWLQPLISQRGKPQPNSPWHEERAEAQSAQRINFAKNEQFFGFALRRKENEE